MEKGMKFAEQMDWDKPKYNRSTRVKISTMLSFLTVDTFREGDWLGKENGWTRILGPNGLEIGGAVVGDEEYYNSLQYGKNLHNPYNNYVNPFYIFEIMNDDGRKFFLNLYKDDINRAIAKAREKAAEANKYLEELESFWVEIGAKIDAPERRPNG